jgi:SAM-dependent methyltransferase
MPRGRGPNNVRAYQREHVAAREALERAYHERIEVEESFGPLVTAEGGREEPFHRWHPYRQAFSPELVRRFLAEAEPVDGPILDPFSGSGTTVTECARQGRAAFGVDAVPVLAWLVGARFATEAPAPPSLPAGSSFTQWYEAATTPLQRAAVLLAAGRTVSGAGRPKRVAEPEDLVRDVYAMMAEDLQTPLAPVGRAVVGDARSLPFAASSCGGAVTSPPYLSRYDYARINAPMEKLHRGGSRAELMQRQLRAAVGVKDKNLRKPNRAPLPEAAEEAARGLEMRGNRADAAVVRNYFADLARTLAELRRVLRPGAPCWVVIGGADLDREYVPADLICAEQAVAAGFRLEMVTEARKLRFSFRRLGLLDEVAPRESIVRLRRGPDRLDEDDDA